MASKFDSVWVPTLQGAFLTSYEGVLNSNWSLPITRRYDAPGEFLKLADIGTVGAVRQLEGRRQFTSPRVYTATLQNLPYELTMPIDVEDYNRDAIGLWESKASEMGAKFGDHINKLNIANITSNPTCFDGTAYFGSQHPVNNTTQTNDISSSQVAALASAGFSGSTAAAPTALQMANVIVGVCAYFYSLIDEAGDPINGGAREFEIVTSNPAVYAAVLAAVNSFQLSQGQTNPLYAGLENQTFPGLNSKQWRFLPAFDPRLGSSTSAVFYAFRTDSEVKPLVWAEEKGLEMKFLGPGSTSDVLDNQYIFAAKAVRSVGVGRYQHALRCTLS
jgi:phage major head subunit gpT-like protein